MKKIIKAGMCVAAAAVIVTGCGNKNQNTESSSAAVEETVSATTETETKSEEELHDEESVTLGDYKNLTFSAKEEEVTDAQVETRLKELCAEYPVTIEGRPAQEGDTANIDYSGTKDGEAFAGGTAEGYDLKLGSGTFIDGFEDGVIGMGEVADPAECAKIAALGIDFLAAGIGNIHGKYPANWKGLDFVALDKIHNATDNIPLVLHGGTGIPDEMIKKAISLGVSKINVNTECQLSFADATRKYIEAGKDLEGKGFDPRKLLAPGAEAIKATVREKIELFGSANKA